MGISQWRCVATCQAHEGSLSCLDLLEDPQLKDGLLLFTAGSDSTLKMWRFSAAGQFPNSPLCQSSLWTGTELQLAQTVSLKAKLPLAMSVVALLDREGMSSADNEPNLT
jgi:hypothetical protein